MRFLAPTRLSSSTPLMWWTDSLSTEVSTQYIFGHQDGKQIGSSTDKTATMRISDCLGAIATACFGEDAVHVSLDGGLTDEKPPADLGVGTPGGDQSQDLGLSLGQAVGQGSTPASWQRGHVHESGLDRRVEYRLARGGGFEGPADVVPAGVLGDIPDCSRP